MRLKASWGRGGVCHLCQHSWPPSHNCSWHNSIQSSRMQSSRMKSSSMQSRLVQGIVTLSSSSGRMPACRERMGSVKGKLSHL